MSEAREIEYNKNYKIDEENYFDTIKFLDELTGVKKEIRGRFIIYSPATPNPELRFRAITDGSIIADNNKRTILISKDIEMALNLEKKLKEKLFGN